MGGRTVSQNYRYTAVNGIEATERYEKDNLPVRYTMSSTRYIDYTYDGLNRLTGKTLSLATPLVTRYSYKQSDRTDATYRTTMIANEIIGTTAYGYLYDDLGNITAVLKAEADGNGNKTGSYSYIRTYEYDSLNQLIRENNKTDNKTYVYEYDGYGNITVKKIYAYTTSATLGTAEKTISYVYGEDDNAGWKNILTRYNGEDIIYDAIGNPVSYRGADLTWGGRELKKYKIGNDFVVEYTYDADGLRASKTVNGVTTNYQYVSGKLMYEECNGAEKYYFYDSNGVISGIRYFDAKGNMTMIYVVTNALGDVIALYDKNGNAVVEYQYDAWGNIISTTNGDGSTLSGIGITWNDINPFRYRGYYWDSETGLYYLQSRYYDSETGRFINADDASVINATPNALIDKNLFSYCDNNPITRIDESGYYWLVNFVSGVVSGGIELGIQLIDNGGNLGDVNWGKVAIKTVGGAFAPCFGAFGGSVVDAATDLICNLIDGEKDPVNLFSSACNSFATSYAFSGALDKLGGYFKSDYIDDLSGSEIKRMARKYNPDIKGRDINSYKNVSVSNNEGFYKWLTAPIDIVTNTISQIFGGLIELGS